MAIAVAVVMLCRPDLYNNLRIGPLWHRSN
jgi:hypothetical protein